MIATPVSLAALAAKAATTTIPIVFATAGDPVQMGLVASLNRPGGNVTGVATMGAELTAKRLGLLRDLVPGAKRFAALLNGKLPSTVTSLQSAASAMGQQIGIFTAGSNLEIDAVFAELAQNRTDALLVGPSPLFSNRRVQIVMLTARHGLPAIYTDRPYCEVGGLMSYGSSVAYQARQVGFYTGRILKGEKPADLPVQQATNFEFVINVQTARTFGLTVSPALLSQADEVIEWRSRLMRCMSPRLARNGPPAMSDVVRSQGQSGLYVLGASISPFDPFRRSTTPRRLSTVEFRRIHCRIVIVGEAGMQRRDFIKMVGGGVAGWPLAANAQKPAVPVIGVLESGNATSPSFPTAAFYAGLKEAGFVERQNVTIEYRMAETQYDRLQRSWPI